MYGEVEIELVCEVCGEDLEVEQGSNRIFNVSPCQLCLREAKKEGYEEGYSDGKMEEEN